VIDSDRQTESTRGGGGTEGHRCGDKDSDMSVPGLLRGACSRRCQQQLEAPLPDARFRVMDNLKWLEMGGYPLNTKYAERLKDGRG
jgi:hypothetical protein